MELVQSIFVLLSWQWLVLILALSFHRQIRRLIDRVVEFSFGGEKGVHATLAKLVQQHGQLIEESAGGVVQKRVDAELFVLRDANGNERAKLGVTDTSASSLTLYDPKGKERLSIFVLADGSSTVALYDDQGIRTTLSRSDTFGVEGLSIRGPDRTNGAFLLVGSEGHPSFDMTDQRGLAVFNAY